MSSVPPFKPSQRLALATLPPVLGLAARIWAKSWRLRIHMPPVSDPRTAPGPFIYALWHESIVAVLAQWCDHPIQGMASRSFDGTLISLTMSHMGFPPPSRGSSSRGGADALQAHLQALQAGHHVAITIDGPRGPAYQAKPGVLRLARDSGRPVVMVSCAVHPPWRLRNWDRTQLPAPGARVAFALSTPLLLQGGDDETPQRQLHEALEKTRAEAERILFQWPKQTALE